MSNSVAAFTADNGQSLEVSIDGGAPITVGTAPANTPATSNLIIDSSLASNSDGSFNAFWVQESSTQTAPGAPSSTNTFTLFERSYTADGQASDDAQQIAQMSGVNQANPFLDATGTSNSEVYAFTANNRQSLEVSLDGGTPTTVGTAPANTISTSNLIIDSSLSSNPDGSFNAFWVQESTFQATPGDPNFTNVFTLFERSYTADGQASDDAQQISQMSGVNLGNPYLDASGTNNSQVYAFTTGNRQSLEVSIDGGTPITVGTAPANTAATSNLIVDSSLASNSDGSFNVFWVQESSTQTAPGAPFFTNIFTLFERSYTADGQASDDAQQISLMSEFNQGDPFLDAIESSAVACYCKGTSIETDRGNARIEDLSIGDAVRTLSGDRRIRWIGKRSYDGRFISARNDVLPICIKAGALSDHVPLRDLWISPRHAMHIDGVLIEARDLVNGVSIVQAEQVDKVEYFHIELDTHDVILAEGAPSETFVDDDSREMFHNAHEYFALYPTNVRQRARYYAPRLDEGYQLEEVRKRLATRAGIKPSTGAPEKRVFKIDLPPTA